MLRDKLTILGQQGDCEYARHRLGFLYYRFLWDPPDQDASWKPVAR